MSLSVHKAMSPLPGGRLAFERAIRYSSLPAPARHLALTIATWADIESGLIPDRFQPAQTTLEEATGLSRGAVFKHSKLLEAEGWLIREGGGGRSKRTKHILRIPPGAPTSRAEKVSPGDRYPRNVSPGESETCHVTPETSHVVDENVSPRDTKSSCSSDESLGSPSSSPAGPADTEPPTEPEATDGGGGGSDLRSIAEHIADSLDYLGQVPDKRQQEQVTAALVAVLEKGWPVEVLPVYLRLGNFRPDNPVAFYLSKLTTKLPPKVPTLAPSPAAAGGVRGPMPDASMYAGLTLEDVFGAGNTASGGTDGNVAAWMKLSRDMGRKEPHRPFRNYTDDSVYDEPFPLPAGSLPPWCGEPECNENDRMRDGIGDDGLPNVYPCPKCHPDRRRNAA